jgi:hypothetical protein
MRNIKARTVLLSVGMSTLVLAAAIGSALAKQAHTPK